MPSNDLNMNLILALILASAWGTVWAIVIQYVPLAQFLARKRTWITVAIGVGVDLAIALLVIPPAAWLKLTAIMIVSSIAIIFRSLYNEQRETHELLDGFGSKDQTPHTE